MNEDEDKDFFGESDSDNEAETQHEFTTEFPVATQEPPLMLLSTMAGYETVVTNQPEEVWFQFKEGPCKITFRTNNPWILSTTWMNTQLQLRYNDDKTPVVPRKTTKAETFKILARRVINDTVSFDIKVYEISKSHLDRRFCFRLVINDGSSVETRGFHVMTKRTKPKQTRCTEASFREQTRHVLFHLQWSFAGYDAGVPMHICMICRHTREQNHKEDCPIPPLLDISRSGSFR